VRTADGYTSQNAGTFHLLIDVKKFLFMDGFLNIYGIKEVRTVLLSIFCSKINTEEV
jgi:hypothetical protein